MSTLKIFTDGGSRGNPGPAAIGVYVLDENMSVIESFGRTIGITTNNVAEYTALISALEWLVEFSKHSSLTQTIFHLDSQLVVEQVNGRWKVKHEHIKPLVQQVQQLSKALLHPVSFVYIPRAQNAEADRLVNEALDRDLKLDN